MPLNPRAALLAVAAAVAIPSIASAQGVGVPGCINLPEYNRALGALQGMESACDMSVEQARRVIAEHNGTGVASNSVAPEPAPPRPRNRRSRHVKRVPHR